MSTAAVMLVKDEADVIEVVVRHLLEQVDEILIADNLSTDGTGSILKALSAETSRVRVELDREVGYRQSDKTTNLARRALSRGHAWVVPCDADEVWYSPFGRIGDILEAAPAEFLFAPAVLHDHLATALDDPTDPDPTTRIGWRFVRAGVLPKVACRLNPGLVIGMGNHDARSLGTVSSTRATEPPCLPGQLVIRHFSWRSPEQYLRKIRNGGRAYAASGLDEKYGGHWRMWDGLPDEAVLDHFHRWYWEDDPEARVGLEVPDDERLIYDPAPVSRGERTPA